MIDKAKKYRTRNGCEYRNYCTDAAGNYPVHGAYFYSGRWKICMHTISGAQVADDEIHNLDLIEVKEPERVEFWTNVYKEDIGDRYGTKQDAKVGSMAGATTIGIELLIHDDGRKEARILEVV